MSPNIIPMRRKQKTRRMKLEISAKPEGFRIEWNEPEEKAEATFLKLYDVIKKALKKHGLHTH